MKQNIRLPDVLFTGVYKAGTTFLRGYFSQHSEVFWTRKASYFQSPEYKNSTHIYTSCVPEEAKCYIDMFEALTTGHIFSHGHEWSNKSLVPGYVFDKKYVCYDQDKIAKRIKQTLPNVKVIMVLRNQESWLRSSYLHHLEKLPPKKNSFSNFLDTPLGSMVLKAGYYDQTISAYYKYFKRENVHVMLLEELITEQTKTLTNLCHFLGVKYEPYNMNDDNRNEGKGNMFGIIIRNMNSLFGKNYIATMPKSLRAFGKTILSFLDERDVLSFEDIENIQARYAESNTHTAGITRLNLARYKYSTTGTNL